MSIVNIKTRWLRRTLLVIVSVPVLIAGAVLAALLGIQENVGGLISDIITVWRQ